MKFQSSLEHALHLAKQGHTWAEITLQTGIRPTYSIPEINACNVPLGVYKEPLPDYMTHILGMFNQGDSVAKIVDKLWGRYDHTGCSFPYKRVKQLIICNLRIDPKSCSIHDKFNRFRRRAIKRAKQIKRFEFEVSRRLKIEQYSLEHLLNKLKKEKAKQPTSYKTPYKKEWVKKSQDIKSRNRERLVFRGLVAKYHFQEQQQLNNLLLKLTPNAPTLQEKKTHNAYEHDLNSRVMIHICHRPRQSLVEVATHFNIPLKTLELFIKSHLPQLKEWLNTTPVMREQVISEYFIKKKRFEISNEENKREQRRRA